MAAVAQSSMTLSSSIAGVAQPTTCASTLLLKFGTVTLKARCNCESSPVHPSFNACDMTRCIFAMCSWVSARCCKSCACSSQLRRRSSAASASSVTSGGSEEAAAPALLTTSSFLLFRFAGSAPHASLLPTNVAGCSHRLAGCAGSGCRAKSAGRAASLEICIWPWCSLSPGMHRWLGKMAATYGPAAPLELACTEPWFCT
mmetsp:Transcript_15528/g.27580  ORF Transcript_15528/g.27580 Transcript_15528/m.27580 type:complete len:201 (-) Transcript_15528:393-995(-)